MCAALYRTLIYAFEESNQFKSVNNSLQIQVFHDQWFRVNKLSSTTECELNV